LITRKRVPRRHRPAITGPLSSRALFELSLLSTFNFVIAALLLQLLMNSCTALLLKVYGITFQYSLFAIEFLSDTSLSPGHPGQATAGAIKWSEEQIYLIYATGPVLLSAAGFLLLLLLKKLKNAHWKVKLALTWMAFLMVNTLACSVVAGVFFYDGFGVALHWIASSSVARMLMALLALVILVFFSRFWQRMFLKASYTTAFFDIRQHQMTYIKNVFLKPWIYGLLILLVFNWPFSNLYWRTFLLSFGFMSIALLDRSMQMHRQPHIRKHRKRIFRSWHQPVYFTLVLVLIWVLDNFVINF
jgi:hypothetical protein